MSGTSIIAQIFIPLKGLFPHLFTDLLQLGHPTGCQVTVL